MTYVKLEIFIVKGYQIPIPNKSEVNKFVTGFKVTEVWGITMLLVLN